MPSPFQQPSEDRSARELARFHNNVVTPLLQGVLGNSGDPLGAIGAAKSQLSDVTQIDVGEVAIALPLFHWYYVRTRTKSHVPACRLDEGSFAPFGGRSLAPLAVGARVVILKLPGLSYWSIIGALPPRNTQWRQFYFDFLTYGSNAGYHVEGAYKELVRQLRNEGKILDFGGFRPPDALPTDVGFWAPTGAHLLVNDQEVQAAIHEACGLFLNRYDGNTRLAGSNLEFRSLGSEETRKFDEGEFWTEYGETPYLWEQMGRYGQEGSQVYKLNDPVGDPEAALRDGVVVPAEAEQEPFYRVRRYGGYLGQGGRRAVVAPKSTDGLRTRDDGRRDVSLFEESIGLNGAYSLRTAASYQVSREVAIPTPRRIKKPEDTAAGDSAKKDNYKFAGAFGGGEPHILKDLADDESAKNRSGRTAAAAADVAAYQFNWMNLHPFHYHQNDYEVPEPSDDSSPLHRNNFSSPLDFNDLKNAAWEPEKVEVGEFKPDPRFEESRYYYGRQYLSLLPDGGVVIGDAFGSELRMAGGDVFITAPGRIWLQSGHSTNVWAGFDVNVRAQKSIDLVASTGDIHQKAEKNFQILAGAGGQGGVLLESKAESAFIDFTKPGEEAISSGILLKAAHGPVLTAAQHIYLRTGSDGVDEGDIILDAAKGNRSVIAYASTCVRYLQQAADYFMDGEEAVTANLFSKNGSLIAGGLGVGGTLATTAAASIGGALLVIGSVGTTTKQQFLGNLEASDAAAARARTDELREKFVDAADSGTETFDAAFTNILYADPNGFGSAELQEGLKFSYRDDEGGEQYGLDPEQFALPEARFQQMLRTGEAVGGSDWEETPIDGRYPYPGKLAFEGQALYVYTPVYYSPDDGTVQQGRPYDGEMGAWEGKPLKEYKAANVR